MYPQDKFSQLSISDNSQETKENYLKEFKDSLNGSLLEKNPQYKDKFFQTF